MVTQSRSTFLLVPALFLLLGAPGQGCPATSDEGKEHKGPASMCCSHPPAWAPLTLPLCGAPHGHILHPNPWLSKTTVIPSITATLFKLFPLPSLGSIPRVTLRPQRMPHGTAFSDLAVVMWGQQQTPGHTTTFPDHDLPYQALRFTQLPPTSPTKRHATTKMNKLPPNQCLHGCGGARKRRRAQPCPWLLGSCAFASFEPLHLCTAPRHFYPVADKQSKARKSGTVRAVGAFRRDM